MGDRKFILLEVPIIQNANITGGGFWVDMDSAMTESELLHRLSLCVTSKDRISTLLDGEAEQVPYFPLKNDTDATMDTLRIPKDYTPQQVSRILKKDPLLKLERR